MLSLLREHIPGLAERPDSLPSDLSSGERQMLCLLMAVVRRPGLLLLDDPLSMLDPDGADRMTRLIHRVAGRHHLTVVMGCPSCHALHFGDLLMVMHRGRMVFEVSGISRQRLRFRELQEIINTNCLAEGIDSSAAEMLESQYV